MNCSSCNAVVDPRNVLYSPEANVIVLAGIPALLIALGVGFIVALG